MIPNIKASQLSEVPCIGKTNLRGKTFHYYTISLGIFFSWEHSHSHLSSPATIIDIFRPFSFSLFLPLLPLPLYVGPSFSPLLPSSLSLVQYAWIGRIQTRTRPNRLPASITPGTNSTNLGNNKSRLLPKPPHPLPNHPLLPKTTKRKEKKRKK